MAGPTKTFYIFYGADDIALRDALTKMRGAMGDYGDMNTSEFDGPLTSVPEILNAVSSYPFLSDRRLVIVHGLLAALTGDAGRKAQAQLVEAIADLPDHARLVLVESGKIDARNAVLKAATDLPTAVVRAFDVPEDVGGWIVKRAGLYDVTIEPRAAAALADVAGADLHALDSELSKLADYAHPRTNITEDDVAAMTAYVPEANIFKLVDAIAKGDGGTAMQALPPSAETREAKRILDLRHDYAPVPPVDPRPRVYRHGHRGQPRRRDRHARLRRRAVRQVGTHVQRARSRTHPSPLARRRHRHEDRRDVAPDGD
ncbi:MAG: DNA polymerase III subunit delta [Chloroflexi bacterium]|nr:DNA polymerase III subunit delta [Chloroflexota bacterium]